MVLVANRDRGRVHSQTKEQIEGKAGREEGTLATELACADVKIRH